MRGEIWYREKTPEVQRHLPACGIGQAVQPLSLRLPFGKMWVTAVSSQCCCEGLKEQVCTKHQAQGHADDMYLRSTRFCPHLILVHSTPPPPSLFVTQPFPTSQPIPAGTPGPPTLCSRLLMLPQMHPSWTKPCYLHRTRMPFPPGSSKSSNAIYNLWELSLDSLTARI